MREGRRLPGRARTPWWGVAAGLCAPLLSLAPATGGASERADETAQQLFQHVEISVAESACRLGATCNWSWRLEADGRLVHRQGGRVHEGTLPAAELHALTALAVSDPMLSEARRSEPCPDRSRRLTEIEIGVMPGLSVRTETGDCEAQPLGALTRALQRAAHDMFPDSRPQLMSRGA